MVSRTVCGVVTLFTFLCLPPEPEPLGYADHAWLDVEDFSSSLEKNRQRTEKL